MISAEISMQKCGVCGETKPYSEFTSNGSRRRPHTWCKVCCRKYQAERYRNNEAERARRSASATASNRRNAEKRAEKASEKWRSDPEERSRRAANQRARYQRKREDPLFVLHAAMSNGLRRAIGTAKARSRWFDIAGYTSQELRQHLERQFTKGMSWDNYGEWHVDHIMPIASFDFSHDPLATARAAWALSNLRPLWRADNMKKSATITHLT